MATESLIVELDARTQKLDKALTETNKKLDKLGKQTDKNDKSFAKLTKVASGVGTALKATSIAGLALATALTAIVLKSAASQRELGLLSRQAKLSTDDFEALAFATKQYGINAEQIADISKDLSDKMGEFSKVGTGPFQDIADVIGLTKDEAKLMAAEFENMSSDKVIGELVSRMEAAGATSNQMTFALESMGNDLSRLIPLFVDGSKELKALTSTYESATKQLSLTAAETEKLQEAATSFDLMTDSLGKAGTLISAQIAPVLTEFFGYIIEFVPRATQTIIDFLNSFKDASEITNLKSFNNLIEDSKVKIKALEEANFNLQDAFSSVLDGEKSLEIQRRQNILLIDEETKRIDELKEARDKLIESEKEKNEEESPLETKLAKEKELKDRAAEEDAERESMLNDLFKDSNSDLASDIKSKNSQKEKSDSDYFDAASTLGNAFFEDNKAVRAGLVVVDTAAGISKAFADLPYPAALAASASIAATGVAQLAAINSATKGGSGGGGGVSSAELPQEEEPTSDVNVQTVDASGAGQAITITFASDGDSDELAVAMNGIINQAKVNGSIS